MQILKFSLSRFIWGKQGEQLVKTEATRISSARDYTGLSMRVCSLLDQTDRVIKRLNLVGWRAGCLLLALEWAWGALFWDDKALGRSTHPMLVHPVCSLYTTSWYCSIPMAFFTSSSSIHFLPVTPWVFMSIAILYGESITSISSLIFSCLINFRGSALPKKGSPMRHLGSPSHIWKNLFILLTAVMVTSHSFSSHITLWYKVRLKHRTYFLGQAFQELLKDVLVQEV